MAGFTGELLSIERFYDPINDGGNYTVALRLAVAWLAAHGLGSRSGFEWPPGLPSAPGTLSGDVSSGFVPPMTPAGRGGVIYFPPKSDGSGYSIDNPPDDSAPYAAIGTPSTCNATVVVPGGITLMFAPGAYLQIQHGNVITIGGAIEAGLQKIFDVVEDSYVVFNGNEIKEVYPEWWGAGAFPDGDDFIALQAAINAAFNFRYFYYGIDQVNNLPPIPLRLSGNYQISRTLMLGYLPTDPFSAIHRTATLSYGNLPGQLNSAPFRIIGNAGTSGSADELATIRARSTFEAGSYPRGPTAPMMLSRYSSGFSIEHVSFDGQGAADGCLEIEGLVIGGARSDTSHNNQLSHCSFRGGKRYLVQIGSDVITARDSLLYPDVPGGTSAIPETVQAVKNLLYADVGDILNFGIDRCNFLASRLTTPRSATLPRAEAFAFPPAVTGCPSGSAVVRREANFLIEKKIQQRQDLDVHPFGTFGIILRAGNAVPISIRNSVFRGYARAMIRIFSCSLHLENCTFMNARPSGPKIVDPETGMPLPNSSDIYLDLEPATDDLDNSSGSPVFVPTVDVGLTAINCQSRSAQFFGTFRPEHSRLPVTSTTLYVYNVVIVGLNHFSFDATFSSSAIDWQLPRNLGLGGRDRLRSNYAARSIGVT